MVESIVVYRLDGATVKPACRGGAVRGAVGTVREDNYVFTQACPWLRRTAYAAAGGRPSLPSTAWVL